MISIQQYRERCIGCHACAEIAPEYWRLSRQDGKAVLVGGKEKKGIWNLSLPDSEWEINEQARKACPVNIIQVRKT